MIKLITKEDRVTYFPSSLEYLKLFIKGVAREYNTIKNETIITVILAHFLPPHKPLPIKIKITPKSTKKSIYHINLDKYPLIGKTSKRI